MDFWSKIALDGLVDLLMFSGLGTWYRILAYSTKATLLSPLAS